MKRLGEVDLVRLTLSLRTTHRAARRRVGPPVDALLLRGRRSSADARTNMPSFDEFEKI
jgi:hypothetical protein